MAYPIPQDWFWLFWPLLLVAGILFIFLNMIGRPLKTSAAPDGIVSLELAAWEEWSREILSTWQSKGVIERAKKSILLDCLFIPAYTTTCGIACAALSGWVAHWAGWLGTLGLGLAWLTWAGGLLDYAENFGLWKQLKSFPVLSDSLARFTCICALLKFLCLLLALIYALPLGVALWLVYTLSGSSGKTQRKAASPG